MMDKPIFGLDGERLKEKGLPALPPGWSWTAVEQLIHNFDGRRIPIKSKDRSKRPGPYPYYGASGIIDSINDFIFEGDFLLIAEDGANLLSRSTPIAFQASGRFWVNNHAHVVQLRGGIPLAYLEHYLNGTTLQFFITGTAQPKLNQLNLHRIPVPLAPLNEQLRIVDKIEELFSDLNAGVEALNRAKANLTLYRIAILKDAVEGRLTAQWRAEHPHTEDASHFLSQLLIRRRQKWESEQFGKLVAAEKEPPRNWRDKYIDPSPPDLTGLPDLPQGWCWASIEQLSVLSEYGTSVKCDYGANGPPVLRIPNIAAGLIDLDNLKCATQPLPLTEDQALQYGDMLMCRTNGSLNLLGKAAVVRNAMPGLCSFASYLLRFRFADPTFLALWVHVVVSSPSGRQFIERNAPSSAGQYNISLSLIHRMPIPLPPAAEQERILSEVEERLSVIGVSEKQIQANLLRSAQVRQSILKQAFEGKLVSQNSQDESASVLLDRIHSQRDAANESSASTKLRKSKGTSMNRREVKLSLIEVVAKHPRGVAPDDVFSEAGYDQENVNDVDLFYAELDRAVKKRAIEVQRPDDSSILLLPRAK
jgi:type I restriction enzyme S subunit